MGIFDIFKKKASQQFESKSPPVLRRSLEGPTFLEGYTSPVDFQEELPPFEWKRKLKSLTGGKKFRVKYYGQLVRDGSGLLVGRDFAPLLVVAIDQETDEEILLFDGCKHGYNAMFCDTYTREQIEGRKTDKYYADRSNNEVFEITLSANYQMSEEEFLDMIDKSGKVELLDGTVVNHDIAWRNCYDVFQIFAINEKGKIIEIVSEELA